ncbi:hypothetical protein BJY01DRAFT_215310 [Aspergillus pseudoustus]|uniref:Zn(2)-C6 fungal-type domain-containing protein n=1 Tax=Aspergillus pseudoustus TaxID=1810923 RepID=A0ABR4JY21_9EURO
MAADTSVRHAANVCLQCRARKKKCDKRLPYCGFCMRKGLECDYQYPVARSTVGATVCAWDAQAIRLTPFARSSLLLMDTVSSATPSHLVLSRSITPKSASSLDATIYLQVQRIIDATGQSVAFTVQRYLEGIYNFVPVLSRPLLESFFLAPRATPTPDLSILLLALCLITYHASLVTHGPDQGSEIEPETLYLATKSLFAQVQSTSRPSIWSVQAGLLLAIYEYARGTPEQACISIANCARAAQLAINCADNKTTAEERRTWWCIAICERLIYCETPDPNGLLTSSILCTRDMQLPPEPEVDGLPPSPPSSKADSPIGTPAETSIGWFSSAAQASQLLDQVLHATKTQLTTLDPSYAHVHLDQLDTLDQTLQEFLARILDQRQERWNRYCMPNAISIRALFILHTYTLYLTQQKPESDLSTNPSISASWHHRSHAALETLTKIVTETTYTHLRTPLRGMDALPPLSAYNVREALGYVRDGMRSSPSSAGSGAAQLRRLQEAQQAELKLGASLERFRRRWHVSNGGSLGWE